MFSMIMKFNSEGILSGYTRSIFAYHSDSLIRVCVWGLGNVFASSRNSHNFGTALAMLN